MLESLSRKGRLVELRPLSLADSREISECVAEGGIDSGVPGLESVKNEKDVAEMISRLVERTVMGSELHFAIVRDGRAIGMCAIHELDRRNGSAEIGYWIRKTERRRGFGKEAVGLLADIAFVELRLSRLYAVSEGSNGPSLRLLRSLGFKNEKAYSGDGKLQLCLERS